MSRLVFFLEEPSARKFLLGFLPKIGFQRHEYEIQRPYSGKQDLLKYFTDDLRDWRDPNDQFLVLVDQDANDCKRLKESGIQAKARKKCRDQAEKMRVRIACWELEAWYLGDISALRLAYPDARDSTWKKIRQEENPDAMMKPSVILKKSVPGFHKGSAAEKMGAILGRKCAESRRLLRQGRGKSQLLRQFLLFRPKDGRLPAGIAREIEGVGLLRGGTRFW